MFSIIKVIYKEQKRGSRGDASEDKDTWCQARRAGFAILIPEICSKKKGIYPFKLFSGLCTDSGVCSYTNTHTYAYMNIHTETHTV